MSAKFKVVDLFAGPGGLAEGFSSVRNKDGQRIFEIALSVEKEASAHRTLRLRSFVRQFATPPEEYYDYVAGKVDHTGLTGKYPREWAAAVAETPQLELGSEQAQRELDPILDRLRNGDEPTILIGGPPCQAYSLVGRARNKGVEGYDPEKDNRHFLYQEYIRIIGKLQPAAFVMENVKGILSSKIGQKAIFNQILADLRAAGGSTGSYHLIPVVRPIENGASSYIVRCEQFGVPQARHRVIIVGIRNDLSCSLDERDTAGLLSISSAEATVQGVLEGMPELRSGLSREIDTPEKWHLAVTAAMLAAAEACNDSDMLAVASVLGTAAQEIGKRKRLPVRKSKELTAPRDDVLAAWLSDPALTTLPNHETRGHMREDLARYAFAAAFAEVFGRSPKAREFPDALAPRHNNWKTGKFADRFRVQLWKRAATTVTSHISKDGHYFIHPDLKQCRSLTVREAARLQTFPDNYLFEGNRTEQFVQVGNAVPPLMARQIAQSLLPLLTKLQHPINNKEFEDA
jgi:DNA (cytosine-5)-methyltransferase 1